MTLRANSEVQYFSKVAQAYCECLEKPTGDTELWLKNVLINLSQLYAAVHTLPEVELLEKDIIPEEKFDVDNEEWGIIFMSVVNILGQARWYGMNYDPSEPNKDETVEVGDLADDLADIYRDIKPGLRAWDENKDEYLPEIVWGWRETLFISHWGIHAVNALRILHHLAFLQGLGKENQ